MCSSFKFVRNYVRTDEDRSLMAPSKWPVDMQSHHVGPLFLGKFNQLTSEMPNCGKIDVILHETLKEGANED